MSKKVVVSGYATIDYVLNLKAPFNGLNIVHTHPVDKSTWARPGGATLYTSIQLSRNQCDAYPLVWLGDDLAGKSYLNTCKEGGLFIDAIDVRNNRATPSCFLIYQEDGSQGCLIDNGENGHPNELTRLQKQAVEHADLVCITAGPPAQTKELLKSIPPQAIVAWIAKLDKECFPKDLRKAIAKRTDIIFCNTNEREFVEKSLPNTVSHNVIIIETRGSQGVLIKSPNGETAIEVTPIDSDDTTGAGDTFAGATLGAFLKEDITIEGAVQKGIIAARSLLKNRL